MPPLFAPGTATTLNGGALLLTLVVLVATPVPATLFVALVMLYSLSYLVHHRHTVRLAAIDWLVIGLLLSYLIGRLGPFWVGDFQSRYLSAPLHVAASLPIYLMLRHAMAELPVARYRGLLEWGAALGALGGGALATYQSLALGVDRADGFMFYLNFAYLSCSLMLLCLGLLRGSRRRWLLIAGATGGLVAILFSETRGVLFAIPLLLLLVLWLNIDRIGWKRLALTGLALLGLSLVAYGSVPIVKERVDFTLQELRHIQQGNIELAVSSGGRIQLWTAAIEAFKERPAIGLSYVEREEQIAQLVDAGRLTEWMLGINRGHAHSQFFETLASGGVIGLVALAGYLIAPLCGYLWLHRRHPANPFATTGALFSAGFILYCLTEVALQKELIAAWYGFMQVNLAVLAWQWQRRSERAAPGNP